MRIRPLKSFLRWHILEVLYTDDLVITECMAAASDEGIGVFARWTRKDDGNYIAAILDTEGGKWMEPEEGDVESIPASPPIVLVRSRPSVEGRDPFIGKLIGDWYECAPYGEQVPKELPGYIAAFLKENGVQISEDRAWEIITESGHGDAWLSLFESVFEAGAKYAVGVMADAVCDGVPETLRLIDLQPVGVFNAEAQAADAEHGACPCQHVMHPDYGGRWVFEHLVNGKGTGLIPIPSKA